MSLIEIYSSCRVQTSIYSFKYNQQDATLYIILYYCQALHVSGGFSAHHQELKNCTHSTWYVPGLLPATGSSKQAWHIPDAMCTVLELLMMDGETSRNMSSIDDNKEYCITLRLVGCT